MYYILYTENCQPKVRKFALEVCRESFIKDFLLENQDNEDNYIDLVFDGTIKFCNYIKENGD